MTECTICMHLKPTFIVLSCSDTHKVCKECSASIDTCPFCRRDWVWKDTERIHTRSELTSLIPGVQRNYVDANIHVYVRKYIEELGIQVKEKDGMFKYYIDPISTSIELEGGMTLNLLQYCILEEGYEYKYRWSIDALLMYERAYLSLVTGIDEDIDDIASLYHTIEVDEKITNERYHLHGLISLVYTFVKTRKERRATCLEIERTVHPSLGHIIPQALAYLIESRMLVKDGDTYIYD